MFSTIRTYARYAIVPVLLVVILFAISLFNGGSASGATESGADLVAWEVGDLVLVPNPGNPAESMRLTVLDVDSRGIYEIIDPDGDVFSCLGKIGGDACQNTGMRCPMPATSWALRTPGVDAKWLCSQTPAPQTRADKPAGYVEAPATCPTGQRLWVDMSGGRITGYRCAK